MMRTIGIIGGMSAASTELYQRRLNSEARRRFGGLSQAELLVWSVDFAPIAAMQASGNWSAAGARLADIARRLERAGAEVLILATNTMHKVAEPIERAVSIPFIHIADATAEAIIAAGCKRPGLIATRFTMEEDFYIGRLRERFGLEPIVPDADERGEVHRIIYDELCKGVIDEASRSRYVEVAEALVRRGADCLILGCTEVGMLLNQGQTSVPMFDTTLIHADCALDWATREKNGVGAVNLPATGTHG